MSLDGTLGGARGEQEHLIFILRLAFYLNNCDHRIDGRAFENDTPPPLLRPRAVAGLSADVPVLSGTGTRPLPGKALLNVNPPSPAESPLGKSSPAPPAFNLPPSFLLPPEAMSRSMAAACSSSSP